MILESYHRVFVEPRALDATLDFYRRLTGGSESLRFDYPEAGLSLAAISSPKLSILVIAGSPEARARFEKTPLTIRTDDLDQVRSFLAAEGATVLEEPKAVPTGRNMRTRHPDGLVVEYVEHSKR
jgi:catechol 2,3-dioxygenase-like lactoylglutathione lyase family enzyme